FSLRTKRNSTWERGLIYSISRVSCEKVELLPSLVTQLSAWAVPVTSSNTKSVAKREHSAAYPSRSFSTAPLTAATPPPPGWDWQRRLDTNSSTLTKSPNGFGSTSPSSKPSPLSRGPREARHLKRFGTTFVWTISSLEPKMHNSRKSDLEAEVRWGQKL